MPTLAQLTIRPRGKVTEPASDTEPTPIRFAYQGVRPGLGNIPGDQSRSIQRRRIVTPADPRTPHQRAIRARIADATAAWQTADDATRAAYRHKAASEPLNPFQLWVKDWCQAHPLDAQSYALPPVSTTPPDAIANNANPLDMGTNPTALARIHLNTV